MSDEKPRMSAIPERIFTQEAGRPNFLIDSCRLKHPPTGKGWEAYRFPLYLGKEMDQKNEIASV